jgi:hypothetical protein
MAFRDLHTIRLMFRELSGVDRMEEALFQRAQWQRNWYWRASPADRELIKQRTRSYAKRPDVRAARNVWQREYKRLLSKHGVELGRRLWRERQAAGRALNALFEVPA